MLRGGLPTYEHNERLYIGQPPGGSATTAPHSARLGALRGGLSTYATHDERLYIGQPTASFTLAHLMSIFFVVFIRNRDGALHSWCAAAVP